MKFHFFTIAAQTPEVGQEGVPAYVLFTLVPKPLLQGCQFGKQELPGLRSQAGACVRENVCRSGDLNSTLSDYMITVFQARHSGRDCRNPGSMDGFELTILVLDTRSRRV